MTDHFGDLGDFRCGIVPRMDIAMLSNSNFKGFLAYSSDFELRKYVQRSET
jgi:hypothetical protein